MAFKTSLLILLMTMAGCHVGMISRFDGDGILEVRQERSTWVHKSKGENGAIVENILKANEFALLTPSKHVRFQFEESLLSAISTPNGFIRNTGTQLFEHKIGRTGPYEGQLIAQGQEIRELDYQGSTLAFRSSTGVFIKQPDKPLRQFHKGPSLALSLDVPSKGFWIIKNNPCAVLDYHDLESAAIRFRIPLPHELESVNVQIVRGPGLIAVYATDRPIDNALFVDPQQKKIISLNDILNKINPQSSLTQSQPPLLTPHSQSLKERISVPVKSMSPGVIGSLHGSGFLIFRDRPFPTEFSFELIDKNFQRSQLKAPSKWPASFEAFSWSKRGVAFINNDIRYIVHPDKEFSSKKNIDYAIESKKKVNQFLNLFVAAGEFGLFLPGNLIFGGLITTASPLMLPFAGPMAIAYGIVAIPYAVYYTATGD